MVALTLKNTKKFSVFLLVTCPRNNKAFFSGMEAKMFYWKSVTRVLGFAPHNRIGSVICLKGKLKFKYDADVYSNKIWC